MTFRIAEDDLFVHLGENDRLPVDLTLEKDHVQISFHTYLEHLIQIEASLKVATRLTHRLVLQHLPSRSPYFTPQ